MIQYTIKKAEKEGEEDLIVKVGQSHEFKMSAVQSHMIQLGKNVKTLKAQIELEAAKMVNVSSFHEVVNTLDDKQMVAIALYLQAKTLKKDCETKLAETEDVQKEYLGELAEIKAQTGLELPVVAEEVKTEA